MQAYDLVAGTQGLTMSRFNTPKESHRQFPTLAQTRSEDGNSLKGTVSSHSLVHHDCACVNTECTLLVTYVLLSYLHVFDSSSTYFLATWQHGQHSGGTAAALSPDKDVMTCRLCIMMGSLMTLDFVWLWPVQQPWQEQLSLITQKP